MIFARYLLLTRGYHHQEVNGCLHRQVIRNGIEASCCLFKPYVAVRLQEAQMSPLGGRLNISGTMIYISDG